jgi:hypothetical protein
VLAIAIPLHAELAGAITSNHTITQTTSLQVDIWCATTNSQADDRSAHKQTGRRLVRECGSYHLEHGRDPKLRWASQENQLQGPAQMTSQEIRQSRIITRDASIDEEWIGLADVRQEAEW